MFKKSTTNKQLGLFTMASTLMCKRESKQYDDETGWHMQFYRNVTCNIDDQCPAFSSYYHRKRLTYWAYNSSQELIYDALIIQKENLTSFQINLPRINYR